MMSVSLCYSVQVFSPWICIVVVCSEGSEVGRACGTETSRSGAYSFALAWSPGQASRQAGRSAAADAAAAPTLPQPTGAVQFQSVSHGYGSWYLGLRLCSSRVRTQKGAVLGTRGRQKAGAEQARDVLRYLVCCYHRTFNEDKVPHSTFDIVGKLSMKWCACLLLFGNFFKQQKQKLLSLWWFFIS